MRAGALRCPGCGARIFVQQATVEPVEAVRPEPMETTFDLTELQKEIMLAAVESGPGNSPIYVCGRSGAQGEIKAGERRIFGNDAVAAVVGLLAQGLVSRTEDEDCFKPTEVGARLVRPPVSTKSPPL